MNPIDQLRKANPDFLRETETEPKIMDVPEEIQRLWNHFKRYVEINDRRVISLQKDLELKKTELKGLKAFIDKIKDKHTVEETRNMVFKMNNQSREACTVPIDRNGVAPADVRLDKIFYSGR